MEEDDNDDDDEDDDDDDVASSWLFISFHSMLLFLVTQISTFQKLELYEPKLGITQDYILRY